MPSPHLGITVKGKDVYQPDGEASVNTDPASVQMKGINDFFLFNNHFLSDFPDNVAGFPPHFTGSTV